MIFLVKINKHFPFLHIHNYERKRLVDRYNALLNDLKDREDNDLRSLSNQLSILTVKRLKALRDIDEKIEELKNAPNGAIADALRLYRKSLDEKFKKKFKELKAKKKVS